jgi:hypothetical protein
MAARNYWVAPLPPLNYADGSPFTGLSLLDVSPVPPRTVGAAPAQGGPEQGTGLRLRAFGEYTSTSATPTLTLGFYWGGVAGIALAGAAGLAVSASAVAWPWYMEYEGEFRQLGASGQIRGSGKLWMPTSLTAYGTATAIPATAAARLLTVSTAVPQAVTVGAVWSSATGTPSLTCYRLSVEMIG